VPEIIIGDPFRIKQILINLTSNAINYTAKVKVSVSVRCERETKKTGTVRNMRELRLMKQKLNYQQKLYEKDHDFGAELKWRGFMELVKEEVGAENIEFSLREKKDMLSAIEEYAKEKDPDLLVILKEKRGFFEEIFTGSETKSVLTHFHKPVLVYHEKS